MKKKFTVTISYKDVRYGPSHETFRNIEAANIRLAVNEVLKKFFEDHKGERETQKYVQIVVIRE